MAAKRRRLARVGCLLLAAPLALCALLTAVSALSNIGLPNQSTVLDHLSAADKARLSESAHLRATLGDAVWPGWGEPDIPAMVYNEGYAFLVGYPPTPGGPPAGWVKVPQGLPRGGAWEVVPGDSFEGQPYYRQSLVGAGYTPEAFTVLVGEQWVATFMTKQYAQISFVTGLRAELPPVVRTVAPYRLLWHLIMGESEGYMAALLHESFHAFQGSRAWLRFEQAELVMTREAQYPWDDAHAEWQSELNQLANAALAGSDAEAATLAQQFLATRDARRATMGLSADLIDFERQREWLEGLAKYAELAIGRAASATDDYVPVPLMADDPDFNHYANRGRFWSQQLGELRRMLNQPGEVRFYYTGLAQAALLDRLLPGWKARVFDDGIWLEDLLREAVEPTG